MNMAFKITAVFEAITGVALLIVPSLVGQLLLGEEATGLAVTVARVAGIALISFAVACWPGTPLIGMLIYSTAVMLFLAYVGLTSTTSGILLWPAVGLHLVLSVLMLRSFRNKKKTTVE